MIRMVMMIVEVTIVEAIIVAVMIVEAIIVT